MKDYAHFLWQYTKLLLKNWILWLFLIIDVIGLILVFISPSLRIPIYVYSGLAIIGFYLAGFQVYKELETQIMNNPLSSMRAAFQKVKSQMPELIEEMRTDVLEKDNENIRNFYLVNSGWKVNYQEKGLCYYLDKHENLVNMMAVLENYGFIVNITHTNITKYRMTEEFVELLRSA